MTDARFCPHCGAQARPDARFCEECGQALPEIALFQPPPEVPGEQPAPEQPQQPVPPPPAAPEGPPSLRPAAMSSDKDEAPSSSTWSAGQQELPASRAEEPPPPPPPADAGPPPPPPPAGARTPPPQQPAAGPQAPKKKSNTTCIVVGCAAVALLAVIAAVVVLLVVRHASSEAAATPTRALVDEPTPTPLPEEVAAPAATPTDQPTPPAEATPRVEPTQPTTVDWLPAGAVLTYSDDFSDPYSGWDDFGDDASSRGYEGGRYHIRVAEEDTFAWGNANQWFGNYALEVEATQVGGDDDNAYGLLLHYYDRDNFYRFSISGDGYYTLDLILDGELVELVPWTPTDLINQGQATNVIRVVCDGYRQTYYVNGEFLLEYYDSTFDEGDIGLFAGIIPADADVHVAFDNLRLWSLGPGRTEATPSPPEWGEPTHLVRFEPDEGWDLTSDALAERAYRDGRYTITIKEPYYFAWSLADLYLYDFDAELTVTQVAGDDDNAFGFVFRYVDPDNFYRFAISGDGYYTFNVLDDDVSIDLIPWTPTDLINQGAATNVVRIECWDTYFRFFINDVFVDDYYDDTILAGDIGVFAAKADTPGDVVIGFDELRIWEY